MEEEEDSSAEIGGGGEGKEGSEELVRPGAEVSLISNDSLLDEVEAAEQAKL